MWDDIAILARYLLMLSFNNSLDGNGTKCIWMYSCFYEGWSASKMFVSHQSRLYQFWNTRIIKTMFHLDTHINAWSFVYECLCGCMHACTRQDHGLFRLKREVKKCFITLSNVFWDMWMYWWLPYRKSKTFRSNTVCPQWPATCPSCSTLWHYWYQPAHSHCEHRHMDWSLTSYTPYARAPSSTLQVRLCVCQCMHVCTCAYRCVWLPVLIEVSLRVKLY